jgi:transmembrane sensor
MESMNHERTLQEAARWHARLQAADCTQEDRDAANAWLAQAPEHRSAYELAERVAASVSAMADDERIRAMADEAFAAYQAPASATPSANIPDRGRGWRLATGLAASIAIAMLVIWRISPEIVAERSQTVVYETAAQERSIATLADGSRVQLDVGTRLRVRMSSDRREIELLSGRALFEVAHDANRPFTVGAAGTRTTALGTKFQVHRNDDQVVVTLTEGSVAVDLTKQGSISPGWKEYLNPGEQLSIDAATDRRERQRVDVHMVTSWTQGRHIFRGTPLHAAIEEVNRYATRKVRLGDPSLNDLPVSGNFIVGDSEVVVNAFAALLPLRVVDAGPREIILFRDHGQ